MRVSTETIIRTVVLAITMLNSLLIMAGKNPLPYSEDELYVAFSMVASVVANVWAWWKNNSFTKNAVAADAYLKELKKIN